MVRGRGRGRGVVLVDALVGAVVLGVALTAAVTLAGRSLSAQARGERLQVAATLVDEQLNLVLARGADEYEARFDAEGPCEAPFADYRYRIEIEGGEGGDAYRVRASVTWTEAGRERAAIAETLIAPREAEDLLTDRRPAEAVGRYE